MKSQDIVILLKLICLQEREDLAPEPARPGESAYAVRSLQALLNISKSEINGSILRSLASGLAIRDRQTGRPQPNRRSLLNFIVHGLKFVFPAKPGAMTRGMPTAFAAPTLRQRLISGGDYICVWPSAEGNDMGQSVEPLFKSVPYAAQQDERLYEYLALVDAIRLGNPREAGLAAQCLEERLLPR
ncbi:hypothetical protein [Asticcacaulis sp. AC402]|uniref:hypothetical protein n=1 Tax=Asticcacaulis sp. AC402 TaxID=1282361 RepID=UPI0003C40CD1|nr:hypothetical protein [Asticcacaulis sp. AC402]ESQ75186.1 hypothetical protein ABAC402_10985 [Asticcacaulis sp. AC402]